mmetsp:Transcript_37263/g.116515  ORF Transcript_37263/g.116515 Transcript_37263/m.116515 type:complete len:300 (+) Transcript_37263:245-1144(+)
MHLLRHVALQHGDALHVAAALELGPARAVGVEAARLVHAVHDAQPRGEVARGAAGALPESVVRGHGAVGCADGVEAIAPSEEVARLLGGRLREVVVEAQRQLRVGVAAEPSDEVPHEVDGVGFGVGHRVQQPLAVPLPDLPYLVPHGRGVRLGGHRPRRCVRCGAQRVPAEALAGVPQLLRRVVQSVGGPALMYRGAKPCLIEGLRRAQHRRGGAHEPSLGGELRVRVRVRVGVRVRVRVRVRVGVSVAAAVAVLLLPVLVRRVGVAPSFAHTHKASKVQAASVALGRGLGSGYGYGYG